MQHDLEIRWSRLVKWNMLLLLSVEMHRLVVGTGVLRRVRLFEIHETDRQAGGTIVDLQENFDHCADRIASPTPRRSAERIRRAARLLYRPACTAVRRRRRPRRRFGRTSGICSPAVRGDSLGRSTTRDGPTRFREPSCRKFVEPNRRSISRKHSSPICVWSCIRCVRRGSRNLASGESNLQRPLCRCRVSAELIPMS